MSRRRKDAQSARTGHVGLEQRLLARLKRLGLERERRILVGFSGGPDSLALAAALQRVAPLEKIAIELLHVDHAIRDTSSEEAAAALELARRLNLPCSIVRLDPESISSHHGVGIEEAVRRERYLAFAQVTIERGAALVVLAHHQADQAETVLLHLLRGGGVHGASGMSALVDMRIPWWTQPLSGKFHELTIWRPFLAEPRSEIHQYIARTGLVPIEDPTNSELFIRRNAIRSEVLPLLERISPGAVAALARYAERAAAADEFLSELAADTLLRAQTDGKLLMIELLRGAPAAIAQTAIHAWFRSLQLDPTAERIGAVLDLVARPNRNRQVEVGQGQCAVVVDRRLTIRPCDELPAN